MHLRASDLVRAPCSVSCATQYAWMHALGWGLTDLAFEVTMPEGLSPNIYLDYQTMFLQALDYIRGSGIKVPVEGMHVRNTLERLLEAAPTFKALAEVLTAELHFLRLPRFTIAKVVKGEQMVHAAASHSTSLFTLFPHI